MAHYLTTNNATLHFTDQGQGSTALLFLHYWGGSAQTWQQVMAPLVPKVRCVAMDLRGWGQSRALDGRYDLEAMADDVQAVIEALGLERVVLVGHSMGGKVAQIVAGRLPASLAALLLVAPAPPKGLPVPAEVRQGMLDSYQSRAGVMQALKVLTHQPLGEADREQVITDTLAGDMAAKVYWTSEGILADIKDGLELVTVPVLILVGDKDEVERQQVLEPLFGAILPGAEFRMLADVGHLSPIEAPAQVAQACLELLEELA